MTRILVCGGRHFNDRSMMSIALAEFKPRPITEASEHIFILGGASGADKLAEEWADVFGIRKRVFPANWAQNGKAAGPIRNQRMLDEGRPELVIAFPGGNGTADMVRRARSAGILVREITSAALAQQREGK